MNQETWPLVTIIILTWNQRDLTLDCLASLATMNYPSDRLQIIVVDNGSRDDTIVAVSERFPHITVLKNSENLGYAGGNNVGIRHALDAGADAICILNNDVIVDPCFLGPLLTALQQRPDVGIVTPLIAEQVGNHKTVWALGSTVNWRTAAVTRNHAGEPVEQWRDRPPIEVDIASGAAMLVRREVLQQVGLMDERFFLYFEEVDWSLAVRKACFGILAVPASLAWHDVSATLGATSPIIDYYMLRNHLRLIGRHWTGIRRNYLWSWVVLRNLLTIAAYTVKSHGGHRIPNRNSRLFALRDAHFGRWGKMGADVERVCFPNR